MPSPERPIVYILGTFPQASQTFIHREIRGLLELGVPLHIFALRRTGPSALEPEDRAWYSRVIGVPRSIAPSVVAANARWSARDAAGYRRALLALVTLPHRPRVLAARSVALHMAAVWIAQEIERSGGCGYVHAHFALAQAEVAMALGLLLERPFGFTAHARDIYATPSALAEKIRAASLVVTCTGYNASHLRRLCPDVPPHRIELVYHGMPDIQSGERAGVRSSDAIRSARPRPLLLAAGRLVPKKGFDVLVQACAILRDRGTPFELRIAGTGPLRSKLTRLIRRARLDEQVHLTGWLTQTALREAMAAASAFVVPSRLTERGDRDGIPNVILEAMALGCPVVATAVSAIPEAVHDRVSGTLVPADDPVALAAAIEELLRDSARRRAYGEAGRERIRAEFALRTSSDRLAALFARV